MKVFFIFLLFAFILAVHCKTFSGLNQQPCSQSAVLTIPDSRSGVITNSSRQGTKTVHLPVEGFLDIFIGYGLPSTNWYQVVATESITVGFSLCNYIPDTFEIAYYFKGSCDNLESFGTSFGADDDYDATVPGCYMEDYFMSAVSLDAGESIYLTVSSSGDHDTKYGLIYETFPNYPAPTTFFVLDGNSGGSIVGNTEDSDILGMVCVSSGKADVFEFHASTKGNFTATTCNDVSRFNTVISIATGDFNDLECVTSSDDSICSIEYYYGRLSTTEAQVFEAGDVFYVIVSGSYGDSGDYQLDYSFTEI